MSSQVNEKIHPENAAAQHLADNPQLTNSVEMVTYVTVTMVGTSF
jgi:hypothetical protein